MDTKLKIAAVQMDVEFGNKTGNLARIEERLAVAAAAGAHVAAFPECAVTGYCFDSLAEAMPVAETIPGPSTERLAAASRGLGVNVVAGLLEKDGDRVFNACVLIGPEGLRGSYRKAHLPYLGVDRFTTPGDRPFAVFDTGRVRIGMTICYDLAFPEAARVLALEGADLIVLPTNWPPGAECTADFVVNTRALENKVFFLAVNRVGVERGFTFIGKSKVCDTHGNTLTVAEHCDETILYAEIDVAEARQKRIVRVPDKHIIDRFHDRRPDLYQRILSH